MYYLVRSYSRLSSCTEAAAVLATLDADFPTSTYTTKAHDFATAQGC
jgi:hypothetical protein